MAPPESALRRPAAGCRTRSVYFNGKFYSGALNGVHRVADRLIREIDALALEGTCRDLDLRLLLPKRAGWAPQFACIRKMPQRFGHHQLWEQVSAPLSAAGGVLVNLANLAPIAHGRKLAMVHDAQFLISPASFPRRMRWGYRLLTPLIAATSAQVLTVSEYSRDTLESFGVSPHRKTKVIYNGGDHILEAVSDPEAFARLDLKPQSYAILFGTPALYKNLQVVFAAFALAPPDLKLVIVGGDRAALQAAGLKPPAASLFAGKCSDGQLRALYESALCLLFPSRTEGFGLPPLEAMACGCPVVAAPAGAIPEVCRDAVLYADIFDPAGWAAQIRTLRELTGARAAKIAAGRRRSAEFTWRRAGLALLEEIRRIA